MSSGRYNVDDAATQESANDTTEAAPAPENQSAGVVLSSIERGAIEQVYPSHRLTFRQRLFAVLYAQRLPNSIDLGGPDMSLKWMSRKHVLRLSRQLRVRSHDGITSLDLSCQFLGASGMRMLGRSIARLTGLEDLDLSFNLIGDGAEGAGYLSTALTALTRLKSLNISVNNFDDDACCAILQVIVNIRCLEHVDFFQYPADDITPQLDSCVSSTAWRTANLVQPPPEVVAGGWDRVIAFLRAGPCLPVHELRLMLIGDGEVGKTSLLESFAAPDYRAARISKVDRTVGIIRKPLVLNSRSGPEITCEVCDCAGQEIYHLSHTLYFTRRCLYLLMWSPNKFADDGTAQALSEDEIIGPLKRWLQLLAANVPEATVIIVGTHSQIDPNVFQSMRARVDFHVKEEIQRLHAIAKIEADKTCQIIQQQEVKFKQFCNEIDVALSKHNLKHGTLLVLPKYGNRLMHHNLHGHEKFVNFLLALQPRLNRSLRLKAQELRDFMQVMTQTRRRLAKLCAKYDGSIVSPQDYADLAKLKFVNEHSFAVDSVDGIGIETLLHAIEATCRDPTALPFLSEPVPVSWFQVKEALMQRTLSFDIGDCVLSLEDAALRIRNALKNRDIVGERVDDDSSGDLDDENWETCSSDGGDSDENSSSSDTPSANGSALLPLHSPEEDEEEDGWQTCEDDDEDTTTQELDVQKSLEFWSLLGRVFVYNGYVLRDPWHVMTLMKPLVHHHVISMKFCEEYCVGSFDAMKECLLQLHQRSLLDHRLLSHFKHWAELSLEARQSMLMFFKECFIISDLHRGSTSHGDVSLVTARLCNPGDTDIQDRIAAETANIDRESEYYAVYTITSAHIGLIARMQAAIAPFVQPCRIDLCCGKDHICMSRFSRLKCSVSLRRLEEVFKSNMRSLSEMVSIDEFSHGFIICSNDCGLFSFAAQFVDKIIQTCVFGSLYQSWLACRPLERTQEGAAWRPMSSDWIQLQTEAAPKSLHEILSSNAVDLVIPSRRLRLKDVFPRKSTVFMSHAYGGDGAGEFCQRMKDMLQEKLLSTVWFDKAETSALEEDMQIGMRSACFFVICLTPLYLTRPRCLRELRWALDMCAAAGSKKKMLVIPLHPAVSFKGCERIIAAEAHCVAHVFLRDGDRNMERSRPLDALKGLRLSDEAIVLLTRLTEHYAANIRPDWLKLQPWLSDEQGADWEQESSAWAEQTAVSMDQLVAESVPAIMACMAVPSDIVDLSFFDVTQEHLAARRPSRAGPAPSAEAIIRECYPQSEALFSEGDLSSLILLGLSDGDIMGCVEHGFEKESLVGLPTLDASAAAEGMSRENPVDATFRLAARVSGVDFACAKIKEALKVGLPEVLSALSAPGFVTENSRSYLLVKNALAQKLDINTDAHVFSKNAEIIMASYIELFAAAYEHFSRSEKEKQELEMQSKIDDLVRSVEQLRSFVQRMERVQPMEEEARVATKCPYCFSLDTSVQCSRGHALCGECFSRLVHHQITQEPARFLEKSQITCRVCETEFDMRRFSHTLQPEVWHAFLSAFAQAQRKEATRQWEETENRLKSFLQSLILQLKAQKEQRSLTNEESALIIYIQNYLIIPRCPECKEFQIWDGDGCPHIYVRFCPTQPPICPLPLPHRPVLWFFTSLQCKCGNEFCGWCLSGQSQRETVADHVQSCTYRTGYEGNRKAGEWKFGTPRDADIQTVHHYFAYCRIDE